MEINNKKSSYNFEFLETEIAGICLLGSEIKAIREGKANLVDSYIFFDDNNVWLRKMFIGLYENGGYANHEPVHDRKLLLTKKQIKKWSKTMETENLTIIPVKGFFNKKGIFKILIALAKGKKNFEKRETIKKKDIKRDLDRGE